MNTTTQMKQTADQIKKIRPNYQPVVDFYSRIFLAQERMKTQIQVDPIVIDDSLLSLKKKDQMPLVDQSEFRVDPETAKQLMVELCDIAISHAPDLVESARTLRAAAAESVLDMETFIWAILNDQDSELNLMADRLGIPAAHLAMFGYLCMAPAIEINRDQLTVYLESFGESKQGYCPVCGNAPELAFLDQDGKRHLQCCFCHHQWEIRRMGCVFCNNNDEGRQHYFYSEEEKEYRVYLCDSCQKYIKVVDLRQMERTFISGLEMVCTLHLDMTAREKGYQSHACQN